MIHIVKGVVSEAEVDVFLELSCVVYDPVCVLCILSHFSCVDSLWPVDCSPPGSSVLRILQAGLLEWVAMPPSRGSSWLNTCLWCLLHWQAGSLSLVPHWKPYEPTDVGSLISDSSAFSKSSLYISKFLLHVLLKPTLKDFENYLAGMWNECNCVIVWTFFGISLLWDWNENRHFLVLWPLLSFPNLLAYWLQHFHSSIF